MKCARNSWRCTGLQAADVLKTVNAAYHGTVVAELNQSDRSVPIVVRVAGVDGYAAGACAIWCCAAAGRAGAAVVGGGRWTWCPRAA